MATYKCRKCRTILFTADILVDAHGFKILEAKDCESECSGKFDEILFLGDTTPLPEWIGKAVDEAEWTKGRLTCPTEACLARVGSFNFISSPACRCKQRCVLPNVQLIRSKLDEPTLVANLAKEENMDEAGDIIIVG